MGTMLYTGTLTEVTCWCGMTYAIPATLYQHMRNQRDNNERQPDVYCPLGHTWCIAGKSALDAKNEELERVQREKIWAENRASRLRLEKQAAERSAAAYKGQATKARKRAAAALCPCCNRSFVQLRRHLENKHPDYKGEIT
jgi:hypothetical protein